ncbi:MAG TPA: endolytic transglycosylase MltG [Pantanalinema sp.]
MRDRISELIAWARRHQRRLVPLAASGLAAALVVVQFSPPSKPGSPPRQVTIPSGSSLAGAGEALEAKRIVRNRFALSLLGRLTGTSDKIQPGTYALSPGLSPFQVLECLVEGRGRQERLTVPEGFSAGRIARLIDQRSAGDSRRFLALVAKPEAFEAKYPWLKDVGTSLEGYLFPDTYLYEGDRLDERRLIDQMLARFEAVILADYRTEAHPILPLTEALTLASIVELEAARPEERALISGVFHNRLARRMRLGSDPTVEYALGRHQGNRGLSFKDVRIDSPYNTYRYAGLPPGPIANPGRESFRAALHPEKTPYLYFVAKGDRGHAFTRSYADHLAAQRRYRP